MEPYLFFGGNCEDAIKFYEQKLGAKLEMMMRFSESPEPLPEGMVPPGYEQKIMHASLTLGNARFMVSDGSPTGKFDGFALALTVDSEEECTNIFNQLAEGGEVQMPLSPTFWTPQFGQVTDKFGVGWMVMVKSEFGS